MAPASRNPVKFQGFLGRRCNDGVRSGRPLFDEVRMQGDVGSLSHLERVVSQRRRAGKAAQVEATTTNDAPVASPLRSCHRLPHPFYASSRAAAERERLPDGEEVGSVA